MWKESHKTFHITRYTDTEQSHLNQAEYKINSWNVSSYPALLCFKSFIINLLQKRAEESKKIEGNILIICFQLSKSCQLTEFYQKIIFPIAY